MTREPGRDMPLSIEASDVIRLIQQFLHEQGLNKTLKCLQEETGVTMRTVEDTDMFISDICAGKWDRVMSVLASIQLEPHLLIPLYEQIFLEMAEMGEIDAARIILRQSEPLGIIRKQDETKYIKLENDLSTAVLSKTAGASIDLVMKKEQKRLKIAQDLAGHLSTVPKGRLLTLLGEALKSEEAGSSLTDPSLLQFDIFRGVIPAIISIGDAIPNKCYLSLNLPTGHHVESAAFSPDGSYFAVGLADGFIEVWNSITGKPRLDLPYQTHRSDFMVMETAILSMSFSHDGTLLAVGTLNGDVAIWRVSTGSCIKRIPKAHSSGVSAVRFSRDGNSLLTCGFDNALRLYNLRNGAMQREYVGHAEFVLDCQFSFEGVRVLSVSTDGTLRIWNAKTGECIEPIHPSAEKSSELAIKPVKTISPIMKHPDAFVVCTQSSPLMIYGANGKLGRSFSFPASIKDHPSFTMACSSPSGKYIYGMADDKKLYAFDFKTGTLESHFAVTEAEEIIGACHHPTLNILAVYDTHNSIKFFKAT